MPKAYINIGSNIGDRHAQIELAVATIRGRIDGGAITSGYYYSKPQGFDSENDFVNLGIMAETDADPFELLRTLQEIEKEIDSSNHRDEEGNYIDRRIDIDLIYYGNWEISSPELTLPHPRMQERAFVTEPLKELKGMALK